MPMTFSVSSGGTLSGTAGNTPTLTPLVEAVVNLPDTFGNLTVFGNVVGVALGNGVLTRQAAVAIGNNVMALPSVPGSGTTYWALLVNTTTGAASIVTSSTAAPTASAGTVMIAYGAIPSTATIPWLGATPAINLVEQNN